MDVETMSCAYWDVLRRLKYRYGLLSRNTKFGHDQKYTYTRCSYLKKTHFLKKFAPLPKKKEVSYSYNLSQLLLNIFVLREQFLSTPKETKNKIQEKFELFRSRSTLPIK